MFIPLFQSLDSLPWSFPSGTPTDGCPAATGTSRPSSVARPACLHQMIPKIWPPRGGLYFVGEDGLEPQVPAPLIWQPSFILAALTFG